MTLAATFGALFVAISFPVEAGVMLDFGPRGNSERVRIKSIESGRSGEEKQGYQGLTLTKRVQKPVFDTGKIGCPVSLALRRIPEGFSFCATQTRNVFGMKMDDAPPDVSVIMPAFNASADIRESVLCVLRQTYRSLELLVIDDASTDDTAAIVQALANDDGRIRLLRNASNRGVSFSRNRGIDNARGRFIMFLDSDDLWESTKIETQVAFMRDHACAASYMDYSRFRDGDRETAWQVTAPGRITYRDLLASNEIGMLTAAIDLHRVRKLPRFKARGHEDYIFWLELLEGAAPLPALKAPSLRPLAHYRERTRSVSSNRIRSAFWHWQVLALQDQALPARLMLMTRYVWRALRKRRPVRRRISNAVE